MLGVLQETLYYLQEQNYQLQLYCKLPEAKIKKFKYLQNEIILLIIQQLSKVASYDMSHKTIIKEEVECDWVSSFGDYNSQTFAASEEDGVKHEEVEEANNEEVRPVEKVSPKELNDEKSITDKNIAAAEISDKWLLRNLKMSGESKNADVGEKKTEKETIVVALNTKQFDDVNVTGNMHTDVNCAPVLFTFAPVQVSVQLKSKTTITQATTSTSPKPKHSCGYCYLKFSRKQDKKKHELTHSSEFPYACKPCNRRYRRINGFRRHQASFHGHDKSKYYHKCKICSLKLRTFSALRNHLATHEEQESFACEVCNKIFISNFEMRGHMFAHAGTNSFRCPFCPSKNFRILTAFCHHMKCHGMKIFNCTKCREIVTNKLPTIFEHYETKHLRPHPSVPPTTSTSSSNLSGFPINGLTFSSYRP